MCSGVGGVVRVGAHFSFVATVSVSSCVSPHLNFNIHFAIQLLLDSIATFTATELFDYNTFVLYVVVTAIIALDR